MKTALEKETRDQPLVSVVTPSYNQAKFIEESINSVVKQDYANIEHIIIDGKSTDGSVEIIKRHEAKFAYWVSEPDLGQTNALSKGFRRARGSIFAWLNADDVLAPSTVRLAVAALGSDPRLGLVYGDRVEIDSIGNIHGFIRGPRYYKSMFRRNITIPQESAFFRRDVFEAVGGLDESLRFSMDFDLWCKMANVTELRHIPAFLGCFRRHPGSKSSVFDSKVGPAVAYAAEHSAVFRKHFQRGLPGRMEAWGYRHIHKMRALVGALVESQVVDLREYAKEPARCNTI